MSLQIGQLAPEFTLYDSDKNQVSLRLQSQNILLLFFPLAFTRVCTAELCSIRDNIAVYNSVQARVFGISVDSLYVLAKFKEEQKLNFTLLSDFNKEISVSYGVLYETFSYGMRGVSKRAAFIIDKEGGIRYIEILENASGQPNFEIITKILGEIA